MGGNSGGGGVPGSSTPSSNTNIDLKQLGLALGLQGVGSALNAKAGQPRLMAIPPPAQQFPAFSGQYLQGLEGIQQPSFNAIGQFAQNGLPTNYMDSFNALKAAQTRSIDEGRANLMEKYGMRGTRWGSSMGNAAIDYESQVQKDFGSILAEFARQSQEGAAGRQLQAAQFGIGAGAEPAMATYPTAAIVGGGQSILGAGANAAGSGLLNYLLLQALSKKS
jgi:hypothetical protein